MNDAANPDPPAPGARRAPVALELDARGKRCPLPVIELARHIADVPVGAVVAVLADDEAARVDIPSWCRMRGHDYVRERPLPRGSADQALPRGSAYEVRRAH